MMITGYFLCTSSVVKIRKLISVIIQVFTYSIVCYLIYIVIGKNAISIREFFTAATPIIHSVYWYFSSYVLVYMLHPYINMVIRHSNKRTMERLILIMAIVWGIIPDFLNLEFCRSNFLVFCMFYFIGAYIRLHVVESEGRHEFVYKTSIKVFAACSLVWGLTAVISLFVQNERVYDALFRLYDKGSPLTIILSASLFVVFLNIRSFKSSIINTIAGCVGGVYLLHDNPNIRGILYDDIFNLKDYLHSVVMPLHVIGFVLITFFTCVIIEFIRKHIYNGVEALFDRKGV